MVIKIYSIIFILYIVVIAWLPLAWVIVSMFLRSNAYKSFTILNIQNTILCLSSHKSSRLRWVFWGIFLFTYVQICSIIFLLDFWAARFNKITHSTARLGCVVRNPCHGTPSSWKISLSSKPNIKWSFSNSRYFALSKFRSILHKPHKSSLSTKH